jgi:Calx-beta domain
VELAYSRRFVDSFQAAEKNWTSNIEAAEPDQVVVNVRRTGDKTGNVSVAFATVPGDETPATGGQDYGEIADGLTWDDGDASERQVVVQVFDNGSIIEETE